MDLRGTTIYVARNGHNNQMSRPCDGCRRLIKKYGISKIVYTNESGEVISEWPLSKDVSLFKRLYRLVTASFSSTRSLTVKAPDLYSVIV